MFGKYFAHFFIPLIALFLFSSTFGNLENLSSPQHSCGDVDVEAYCSDCENRVMCGANNESISEYCNGLVCQEIQSFSTCTDAAVDGCDCPSTGNIEFQDKYDDNKYLVCEEGERHIEHCKENEVFDNDLPGCESPISTTIEPPTTTGEPPNCPETTPANVSLSCTEYLTCYSDGPTAPKDCPIGSIFSNDTLMCEAYVPFSCASKPEDNFYADPHNCSIYYLCINNQISGKSSSCPEGELFDDTAHTCVPEVDSTCVPLVDCGVCVKEGMFIAIDCNSYYYCIENPDTDADPQYIPEIKYCPAGTCFSQETTFCDPAELEIQSL